MVDFSHLLVDSTQQMPIPLTSLPLETAGGTNRLNTNVIPTLQSFPPYPRATNDPAES